MKKEIDKSTYVDLKNEIGRLLAESRKKAFKAVNTILLHTYWNIGKHIVDFEQKGKDRAVYGDQLIEKLAKDLTNEYGKGFSRSNLFQIRKFYATFSIVQTVSGQLSWSHYVELLKIDDQLERQFYMQQCETVNWSVRDLKRQMKSMLFHRLALSKSKEEVLDLAKKGVQIQDSKDIIKDPYVFEFLGIPQKEQYLKGELEKILDASNE